MDAEDMKYLSVFLKQNTTLTELDVRSTRWKLVEFYHASACWLIIDINAENKLGDDGAKYLREAMKLNSTITVLELYGEHRQLENNKWL